MPAELAVAILALGGLVVIKPAVDHWDDLYRGDPSRSDTTTADRAEDVNGKKVDRTQDHRRRRTPRRSRSGVLGDSGVLLVRLALVVLAAYLAAALLQRAILGEYGLRRGRPPSSAGGPPARVERDARARSRPTANGRTANGPVEDSAGANLAPGIAKLVAARRETLGLSQRELAKRAGISHTVISRIEGGEHSPSPKTLERLADALR